MIIGIDARTLSNPKTGIAVYTDTILSHFATDLYNSEDSFILYSNKPITISFEIPKNWKIVIFQTKIGTLGLRFKLDKLLKKNHVDVFWGPDHILPRRSKTSPRMFLTIHDLVPFVYKGISETKSNIFLKMFLKPSAKSAEKIFVPSESTKTDIVRVFHIDSKNIVVTPVSQIFSPTISTKDEFLNYDLKDKKFILYLGTIQPRKNIQNLVKAFNLIADPIIYLVLAGGLGWKYKDILKEIDCSPKKEQIICTGRYTDNQKAFLLSNCLFVAFPSLYEGFGIPILEAYSYHKLVVTGNNSSLPEVAGPDAIYVQDVTDVHQLKQGLEEALSLNKEQYQERMAKCYSYAQKFNVVESAKTMDAFFHFQYKETK